MRVGIIVLPMHRWAEQAARWRAVEELGFHGGWTYDHLVWDPLAGMPWGATVPELVAAATVTSRIPLGTWVASPNYRHPVPFARELAALDDVSGGRAVLGVGAGGTGTDAGLLGDPPLTLGERAGRLEEFVEVLDAVLTRPRTSYSGTFYRVVDAATTMPCIQQPRIPFVVAANGPRTMRLAARFGAGWATTGTSSVLRGETDDEAWWAGVARLCETFDQVLDAAGRAPSSIDRMLSVDAAPTFALVSTGYFEEAAGRAAALGFTDLVVHWPVPGAARYDAPESMVEAVAALLPTLRP